MQEELRVICAEVEEVHSDWIRHKHTLTSSPASISSSGVSHIDVPKLDTYDGACNATVIDNFLFELKQYFNALGDEIKDKTITSTCDEAYSDPSQVPIGPVTRAQAKKFKEALKQLGLNQIRRGPLKESHMINA